MLEKNPLNFVKGLRDGLPIALGYLSVSFTFGILVVSYGLPIWTPILTSFTNFTGTGQFIGMEMLKNGAALYEIAFTMFIINIRYVLMAISMSQKMDNTVSIFSRFIIAFGVTDEVYAVSMNQNGELNTRYLLGLMLGSFIGWMSGTILGALAGAIIPAILISAMGITIYAMFIAIIVPPARDSKPVLVTILIAVIMSSVLSFIKVLRENSFYIIIIAGIGSTLVTTFLYPIHDDDIDTHPEIECEEDVLNDALAGEISSSDSENSGVVTSSEDDASPTDNEEVHHV